MGPGMARPRKRHVQQQLFRHGGKRRGAGRKPKGPRASERHKVRPHLARYHPVHVTLRIVGEVRNLRTRDLYKALRWATLSVAHRQQHRFRIVHISIQHNHGHLIAEASDRMALARGVQPPPDYEALWVWLPQTWLLQQAFGKVSAQEVPGQGSFG